MSYFCKIALILSIFLGSSAALASQKDPNISTMNKARELFAKGKLQESINEYNKVSRSSDFWIDSLEEKSWAYVRMGNYGKALSELKSIVNPMFISFVSPEAIMLSAFIDLKTCNYKGVFEKIALFKKEMLPRVEALENIVNGKDTSYVSNVVEQMKKANVTGATIGSNVTKVPRYFYRDKKALHKNRAKTLAKRDLNEISKNLKKMKVIEIEVIQRSFAFDKSVSNERLKFSKTNSNDVIKFPYDKNSQEVWLDEIGHYEVKTQECATTVGALK